MPPPVHHTFEHSIGPTLPVRRPDRRVVHRGWIVNKLELELEGDLNITAVWGTGDVSEKPVGFTDVRVKVDMECEGIAPADVEALVAHVKKWSPVANTFTRPVNLEVGI